MDRRQSRGTGKVRGAGPTQGRRAALPQEQHGREVPGVMQAELTAGHEAGRVLSAQRRPLLEGPGHLWAGVLQQHRPVSGYFENKRRKFLFPGNHFGSWKHYSFVDIIPK